MINPHHDVDVDVRQYQYYRNFSVLMLLGAVASLGTVGINESGNIKNPMYLDSSLMMFAILFGLMMTIAATEYQKLDIKRTANNPTERTPKRDDGSIIGFLTVATQTLLFASVYAVCAAAGAGNIFAAPSGNNGPQGAGEIAAFSAVYGTLFLMSLANLLLNAAYTRQMSRIINGTEIYRTPSTQMNAVRAPLLQTEQQNQAAQQNKENMFTSMWNWVFKKPALIQQQSIQSTRLQCE